MGKVINGAFGKPGGKAAGRERGAKRVSPERQREINLELCAREDLPKRQRRALFITTETDLWARPTILKYRRYVDRFSMTTIQAYVAVQKDLGREPWPEDLAPGPCEKETSGAPYPGASPCCHACGCAMIWRKKLWRCGSTHLNGEGEGHGEEEPAA